MTHEGGKIIRQICGESFVKLLLSNNLFDGNCTIKIPKNSYDIS